MKHLTKSILLLSLFSLPILLFSQETQELETFDELTVSGNIEVMLIPAEKESISYVIESEKDINLTMTVNKGTLKLKITDGIFREKHKAIVKLYYNKLRDIRALAGSQIYSKSKVTGDQLVVKARSGAIVELTIEMNAVQGGAYEGGELYLSGKTERQKMSASTGGQYKAEDLDCEYSYVKASSGGEAFVVATNTIEVSASLGGTVNYSGDPLRVEQSTSLGGNIYKQ